MEQYHRIFTEQLEGKLWKGRDPETEVKDLPGGAYHRLGRHLRAGGDLRRRVPQILH